MQEHTKAELADYTEVNQQRFISLLKILLLMIALAGDLFSFWFLIGSATLYVVISVLQIFSRALMFRVHPSIAITFFIFHLYFLFIVIHSITKLDRDAIFWFSIGICQLAPLSVLTLLVCGKSHVESGG